jgi:spermidine/putrescine transport system permease protein
MNDAPRFRKSPLAGLVTASALLFLIFPLVVVVVFSFHSGQGLSLPFEGLSLRWYSSVFQDDEFLHALRNSVFIALGVAVATFVVGTAAAHGLSRSTARGKGVWIALLLLPLTVPGIFLGASLLTAFSRVGLHLSMVTVALAHFVLALPFFFLLARTAFDRLDPSIAEAAADLGATPTQVFRKVIFPQVSPILYAAAALSFMLSFDEFFATFFVAGSTETVPILVFGRLRRTIDPTINVISTLLLVVTIVIAAAAVLGATWATRRRGRDANPVEGLL